MSGFHLLQVQQMLKLQQGGRSRVRAMNVLAMARSLPSQRPRPRRPSLLPEEKWHMPMIWPEELRRWTRPRLSRSAAGDPTQATRTWVLLSEAAEGAWGMAG